MIKKLLLSFAIFGFLFGSPLLTNAQSFTSLKAQLFDLNERMINFKVQPKVEVLNEGEVLGVTSGDVTINLSASPTVVPPGGSSVFTWNTTNAVSCVASTSNSSNNSWSGSKPLSGTQVVVNITTYNSYSLDCLDDKGDTYSSYLFIYTTDDLPKITFKADPVNIAYDGNTKLTWKLENPTFNSNCYGKGASGLGSNTWLTPYEKNVSGSQVISNLKSDSSFYIFCTTNAGAAEAVVYVDVETRIPEVNLIATPNVVDLFGSTTLTWSTKNTSYPCKASGDWTGFKGNGGSQIISGIKNNKVFKLTCPGYLAGTYATGIAKVTIKGDKDQTPTEDPGPLPGGKGDEFKVGTVVPVSPTCSFVFSKTLGYGSRDSKSSHDIALMQSVLVDEGFLSSKDADGQFYSKTSTALRNFQKKYKLSQTGKLDKATAVQLNVLFNEYCPKN